MPFKAGSGKAFVKGGRGSPKDYYFLSVIYGIHYRKLNFMSGSIHVF